MRLAVTIGLGSMLLSLVAAAEPVVTVEILPPRPPDLPLASVEYELSSAALARAMAPRNKLRLAVFASAAGIAQTGGETDDAGAAIGTGALGGTIATGGISDGCRYVSAEGAVFGAVRDGERRFSASTTTSVCLFRTDGSVRDIGAPGFSVQHHLEYDVEPALSSRRAWIRRRVTGHTLTFAGSIFEGNDSTLPYGAALFPYTVAFDFNDQAGDSRVVWRFDFEGVRITPPRTIISGPPDHPDMLIHIPADDLAVGGLFAFGTTTDAASTHGGGLDFARLDGLELPGGVVLDAKIGLAFGSVSPRGEAADRPNVDVTSPRGYVGASYATAPARYTGRLTRDVFATFDGALAIEDRLTTGVELKRWVPGVTVTAFAAYTSLYNLEGGGGDWTAGAAASRTWQLGRHLAFAVTAEAARSYYARLDDPMVTAPVPEAAARVMAVVTARAGTD
jgi:hypothetical protein